MERNATGDVPDCVYLRGVWKTYLRLPCRPSPSVERVLRLAIGIVKEVHTTGRRSSKILASHLEMLTVKDS